MRTKIRRTYSCSIRVALLKSLAMDSLDITYDNALGFFTRFGPSAAPALPDYLGKNILGYPAAICLWNWKPECAAHLLKQKNMLSKVALGNLVLCCPANQLNAAVELLLAEPTLLETSVRMDWARKHLVQAGIHAESLLEIIGKLPPINL